jgi:hypothetical protein
VAERVAFAMASSGVAIVLSGTRDSITKTIKC